jgi:hypothetical protein
MPSRLRIPRCRQSWTPRWFSKNDVFHVGWPVKNAGKFLKSSLAGSKKRSANYSRSFSEPRAEEFAMEYPTKIPYEEIQNGALILLLLRAFDGGQCPIDIVQRRRFDSDLMQNVRHVRFSVPCC